MARMTSGLALFTGFPAGIPEQQLIGPSKIAVAQTRVFLLVADLLKDICQEVLGFLVIRLGLHQFV